MTKHSKYKSDSFTVVVLGSPVELFVTALIKYESKKYELCWVDWAFHNEPLLEHLLGLEVLAGKDTLRNLIAEALTSDLNSQLHSLYHYGTIQGLDTYTS